MNRASVTVRQTGLTLDRDVFSLSYEVGNDSDRDIWLFAGWGGIGMYAEPFLDVDTRTLEVRGRFKIPVSGLGDLPLVRYVRLRSGERHVESISFNLPLIVCFRLQGHVPPRHDVLAKRVVIEIGYCDEDPTRGIRHLPEAIGGLARSNEGGYSHQVLHRYRQVMAFNERNEGLRDRDNEVVLVGTAQVLDTAQNIYYSEDFKHSRA